VQAIHYHLDHLLKQEPVHHESQTLWRHLHKHRAALLLFLERDDVPSTNNASEQALRNSVIYRKVTCGFGSQRAAQLYANLLSILETARRQGRFIFEIIVSLFTSTPALSWIGE
jgi:transposase